MARPSLLVGVAGESRGAGGFSHPEWAGGAQPAPAPHFSCGKKAQARGRTWITGVLTLDPQEEAAPSVSPIPRAP